MAADTTLAGLDALDLRDERPGTSGRERAARIARAVWPKVAAIVLVWIVWELIHLSGWKKFVLPGPGVTLSNLWSQLQTGLLWHAIGDTLERWLIAQILTMAAVFVVTWVGLALIGIQSSFILGIQAGLLAFIPTVGALLAGLIVVLASLASGWVAALSALILFLGVHALESYVLTPIIQRQALDIPPATLFAFQILLGVVFGIWGLALALPLMAIVKVMIDYFKAEEAPRTRPSAMRSKSLRSIPWVWNCSLSVSSAKAGANGPTSISIFPAEISASVSSNMSTSATASAAQP